MTDGARDREATTIPPPQWRWISRAHNGGPSCQYLQKTPKKVAAVNIFCVANCCRKSCRRGRRFPCSGGRRSTSQRPPTRQALLAAKLRDGWQLPRQDERGRAAGSAVFFLDTHPHKDPQRQTPAAAGLRSRHSRALGPNA